MMSKRFTRLLYNEHALKMSKEDLNNEIFVVIMRSKKKDRYIIGNVAKYYLVKGRQALQEWARIKNLEIAARVFRGHIVNYRVTDGINIKNLQRTDYMYT